MQPVEASEREVRVDEHEARLSQRSRTVGGQAIPDLQPVGIQTP